jgi:hypothetical protein
MKSRALVLYGVAVAAFWAAAAFGQPMTLDEVIKLVDKDVSDTLIVSLIEKSNSYFYLTADDLIALKDAGASDYLVNYMIERKPGSAPPALPTAETAAPGPGEVKVNAAGRTPEGQPEPPPPTKFVDLTVNVAGSYTLTSSRDENIFYAAYVDGEKKYYVDQWTRISSFTTSETGHTTTKRVFEPKSFTVKVPAGQHTLALALWTGPGYIDDNAAKAYVVYTKTFTAGEGQPVTLNLAAETDASDRFIIH